MTAMRWLNLVLWGLGDRAEGTNDYRSDILLVVDLLVWAGIFTFAVQLSGFLAFWVLAPLTGEPVYWIGTQLIIGYLLTRNWKKRQPAQPKAQPTTERGVEPLVSEEP